MECLIHPFQRLITRGVGYVCPGVVEKFLAKGVDIREKKIIRPSLSAPKSEWVPVWDDIKGSIMAVLANNQGTLVVDSISEQYRIHRMARFGKLSQVMPHNYTEINTEGKEILRKALDETTMSVVFLQRLKRKYVNDNWSGEFEPDTYTGFGYDVQLTGIIERKDEERGSKFQLKVTDCRQNAGVNGKVISLPEQMNGFEVLLGMVHGNED